MTTIMSVGDSEGTKGRCDARCHKAKHPKCSCCCRGRYHGTGSSDAAQEQLTRDRLGDELTDEFKAAVTPAEKKRLTQLALDALKTVGGPLGMVHEQRH